MLRTRRLIRRQAVVALKASKQPRKQEHKTPSCGKFNEGVGPVVAWSKCAGALQALLDTVALYPFPFGWRGRFLQAREQSEMPFESFSGSAQRLGLRGQDDSESFMAAILTALMAFLTELEGSVQDQEQCQGQVPQRSNAALCMVVAQVFKACDCLRQQLQALGISVEDA